ncbi:MAG TPA: hypothetical protein VFT22_07195 [Kofleriaceae bacterium]|nr:hypothetical protein [Kofleriaceae bacterium]
MSAPTCTPATFIDGPLVGKWTYLEIGTWFCVDGGGDVWLAPSGEEYEIARTVWHSVEDDVISHQELRLRKPATGVRLAR